MPKTRLNQSMRDAIMAHARTIIDCPAEREAEDAARALFRVVVAAVAGDVPPEDMAVLRKYGHTAKILAVQVPTSSGYRSDELCLCPRNVRAESREERTGCHRRDVTPETAQYAVEVHSDGGTTWHPAKSQLARIQGEADRLRDAMKAHNTAREKILSALRTAIHNTTTFEGAVAVWPHADVLAATFKAPSVLAPDTTKDILSSAVVVTP